MILSSPLVPRTLYFNAISDNDWNTLSNWWQDSELTIQATSIPNSIDNVVIIEPVYSNSGPPVIIANANITLPNGDLGLNYTVTGTATFSNTGHYTILTGNAVFIGNVAGNHYIINGNVTFINNAQNMTTGIINGTVYFYNSSMNQGTINGTAYYYDTSVSNAGSASNNIFTISSAQAQIEYTSPNIPLGPVEIVYEKGINGSSILGII